MAMDADQATDIAIADEDQRETVIEDIGQTGRDAVAEGVETRESGGALPSVAHGHRLLAYIEFETAQSGAQRGGDPVAIERLVVELEVRRDDRHVTQRQHAMRHDKDRGAADLDRVLRSADHGRANSLVGGFDG